MAGGRRAAEATNFAAMLAHRLASKVANVVGARRNWSGAVWCSVDWQQQDSINFCRPYTAELTRIFRAGKKTRK